VKRPAVRYGLLGVLAPLGLLVWQFAAWPERPAARAQLPLEASAPREDAVGFVGTASCAGRSCHGRIEAATRTPCAQNEYTLWLTQDRHAEAYRTLNGAAARAMAKRLGIAEAQAAPVCLSCHTNPAAALAPTEPALAERVRHERPFGVGCESCHGGASGWLDAHVTVGWRAKSAAEKEACGMAPLGAPLYVARMCAGCHVGAPPDKESPVGRDVNHDLIAAGHPRLAFEFSAFFANLPPHWQRRSPAVSEARRWALGQTASAAAALALLRQRAALREAPWPEFAEYDCFACHHSLGEPSARQARETGRRPGTLPWGSWYFALPGALAEKRLGTPELPALAQLQRTMRKPYPPRAIVERQADAAFGEMRAFSAALQAWPGARPAAQALLDSLVADPRWERGAGWDTCEQLFLAVDALNVTAREPRYQNRLAALLNRRAFPAGWSSPRSEFDTKNFFRILRGGIQDGD
jgi:hypothetical protein